jgi:hypothetical protein
MLGKSVFQLLKDIVRFLLLQEDPLQGDTLCLASEEAQHMLCDSR